MSDNGINKGKYVRMYMYHVVLQGAICFRF